MRADNHFVEKELKINMSKIGLHGNTGKTAINWEVKHLNMYQNFSIQELL